MANKRSTAGGEGPHIGWRAFTCKFDRSIDRSSVACLVPANLILLSAIFLFHSLLLLACPLLPHPRMASSAASYSSRHSPTSRCQ